MRIQMSRAASAELQHTMAKHRVGPHARADRRTFQTTLGGRPVALEEVGGRASKAAHEIARQRYTPLAGAIDSMTNRSPVLFDRLAAAYRLLAAAGCEID